LGSHILKLLFQWCQVYLRYAWYRLSFGIGKCGLGLKRDFAPGALISRKFFFVSHQLFHTIVYFICVWWASKIKTIEMKWKWKSTRNWRTHTV